MPKWDLNIVLRALSASPFEPLEEADLKHLTWKTAFLLSWGTASRISELHALCMDDDHLQWGKNGAWVELTAGMAFLAKNQRVNQPPRKFRLSALERNESNGDSDLLCPVRALRAYLVKTKPNRGVHTRLFLGLTGKFNPVSIQTLSRWMRATVKLAYEELAPGSLGDAVGAHPHQIRALAVSLAVAHHRPVREVMRAAFWNNESCFSTFYLKDMARYSSADSVGLQTLAAGCSLDI